MTKTVLNDYWRWAEAAIAESAVAARRVMRARPSVDAMTEYFMVNDGPPPPQWQAESEKEGTLIGLRKWPALRVGVERLHACIDAENTGLPYLRGSTHHRFDEERIYISGAFIHSTSKVILEVFCDRTQCSQPLAIVTASPDGDGGWVRLAAALKPRTLGHLGHALADVDSPSMSEDEYESRYLELVDRSRSEGLADDDASYEAHSTLRWIDLEAKAAKVLRGEGHQPGFEIYDLDEDVDWPAGEVASLRVGCVDHGVGELPLGTLRAAFKVREFSGRIGFRCHLPVA